TWRAIRQAKHTVPACPTKPWRSREGRLDNRPGASAPVTDDPKSAPFRRAGVSPSGLKMIRITSFAEKSDQASRFFVLNRSLRRFTPALRDGGSLFVLSTGAEAPAYYRSASPRRRRFYSPAIHPASNAPVVSVFD